MTIVDDFIAAEVAGLTQVATRPVEPFAYGRDLSCVEDIDPRMTEVDPNSPLAIVEALIRRWTCPRGGLPDDPDYGIDVRGLLNRGSTADDLRALEGQLEGEGAKDDRVDVVRVTASLSSDFKTLTINAVITPLDPVLNTFAFTFAVRDGATTLLELSK